MGESSISLTGWTTTETEAVLEAAMSCQTPRKGLAGKTWKQIRLRIDGDAYFKAEYEAARALFVEALESVTCSNALDGWEETETIYDGLGNVKEKRVKHKRDANLQRSILAARLRSVYGPQAQAEDEKPPDNGERIAIPRKEPNAGEK